ncbi:MAG TPA: glycosyltransferase family 9 protein [Candidatus Eisenbacteria bacterium]|nr:glycosyltransferase family 9 protein [Candidatus Eisenbacteria bacterium]
MSEFLLLLCSALVSRVVNVLGRMHPKGTARVLIVKLDHVGDVILATPAIRAMREARPQDPIDVLLAPGSSVALEGNPHIERILYYDSPRYRRGSRPALDRPSPLQAIRDAARGRYSTIVELRGDWWTLLLPFLAGARRRLDRGSVRLGDWVARRFNSARRARPPVHEVETNLNVVRPLLGGRIPGRPAVEIFPPESARESMGRKLAAAGVDVRAPIVCVHPGAAWRPRAWRPERFAAVADWIQDHYHPQVLFVGSPEERDIEAAVRSSVKGGRAFWLAGELTWQEVTALLERARLFIGNEGGPAHVAAASRTPSVVLSGPQEPGRFNPWSDRSVVLHHRVHCCPCRQRVCVHPENPCVNLIEIEEVKAQVRRILGPPESFR